MTLINRMLSPSLDDLCKQSRVVARSREPTGVLEPLRGARVITRRYVFDSYLPAYDTQSGDTERLLSTVQCTFYLVMYTGCDEHVCITRSQPSRELLPIMSLSEIFTFSSASHAYISRFREGRDDTGSFEFVNTAVQMLVRHLSIFTEITLVL